MTPADDEALAFRLLTDLQAAMTTRDLDAVVHVFDADLVVFGTAASNLDREASRAYLQHVLAQPSAIRWDWDEVKPIARDDNVFCFAAVGTVGFDGDPDEERQAFRLTCAAVQDGSVWRIRHFHGSVPHT